MDRSGDRRSDAVDRTDEDVPDGPVVRREIVSRDPRTPASETVLDALEAVGVSPVDSDPVYGYADLEAIDRLFGREQSGAGTSRSVSRVAFSYRGFHVSVERDRVVVTNPAPHGSEAR